MRHAFIASSCLLAALVVACSGATGPTGSPGPEGSQGPQGPQGPTGATPDAGDVPVTSLVSSLDLPESAPYPNSITSSSDGTLFVGGLFGQLVKYVPSSTHGKVIAQIGPQGSVLANVMIDTKTSTLYACSDVFAGTAQNPFANPAATLYAYDLDGNQKGSWALPNQGSSLCEDIAVAPSGDVYVTDPFLGAIDKLAAPISQSSTIETWTSDASLQANFSNPVPPFGVHGVAVNGSSVIASNFSTSALVRIPIGSDGKAGAVVKQKVTITNPERVVAVDATHLLVAEDVWCGAGRLTALTQDSKDADTWSATVVKNGILGATSVTVANGSYYTVESQVCAIITQLVGGPPANPVLPFWIDRVDAY